MGGTITSYRGYAEGPFGQLHFRLCGPEDGVPLLLVHQMPMSHRQFDTVYGLLAERGILAIGVDMPGFGMSDPPPQAPAIGDYATILPALLDHLRIPKVTALGHHTGAEIITEMAALYPDRVRALILNGPVPFDEKTRRNGLAYVEEKERNLVPQPDGSHLAQAFANRLSFANADTKWSLANRYLAEQFGGLGPFWYGHHAAFSYDHEAAIRAITHPVLILTNTGDQIYDLALKTRVIRPDFAFAQIAGGGIDIVDEKPEEWVAAVADYIARLG